MKIWMLEYCMEGSIGKYKFFADDRPPSGDDIREFCIENKITTYVSLGPVYSYEPIVKDVVEQMKWEGCYEGLFLTHHEVVT